MATATLVRELDWDTDAGLYRLNPPVRTSDGARHQHVVVSTVAPVNGDHGSLVFAATADGQVLSWVPLHRSDSDSHTETLAELGYQVATEPPAEESDEDWAARMVAEHGPPPKDLEDQLRSIVRRVTDRARTA